MDDLTGGPPLPKKTPKPLNLAFIPPEAVFALVLDPHQLLESANFSLLADPDIQRWVTETTGFDGLKLEQAIVIGGLGKKLGEFFTGSVIRFREPIDREAILTANAPKWEEVTEGEWKFQRPIGAGNRSFYFADDRTIVAADEATLKKMLAAKPDAESKLLTTLRKSPDVDAALMVLDMEAIRPQVSAFLVFTKLPSPFDVPPYDGVKEVPKNVDEIVARLELSPVLRVYATLYGKTEEAAHKTDALFTNVVEKLGETVDEMSSDSDGGGDMTANATVSIFQDIYNNLRDKLKHKVNGSNVEIEFGGRALQNQVAVIGPIAMQPFRSSIFTGQQEATKQQLQQIGAALDAAAAATGAYPAPANYTADGKPLLSWRVHLLPYLGQKALYDEFHLDEPWDSEHNKKLVRRIPLVYRTPGRAQEGKTLYLLATGPGTVFDGHEGPKPASITDDKGKTILAVKAFLRYPVEWTKPDDLDIDRADPAAKLFHLAQPTFLALFADGTTGIIDVEKNRAHVYGYFTPAGGEETPDPKK